MRATGLLVTCALLSLCSPGCATIMTGSGSDQNVRVHSNPSGAAVYVDGQYRGESPVSVALDRRNDHYVRIEMPGYQTYEQEIHTGFNGWVVGNVLVGGLIGTGMDAVSGASQALYPTDVSASLKKEQGYSPSSPYSPDARVAGFVGKPPGYVPDYAHGDNPEVQTVYQRR